MGPFQNLNNICSQLNTANEVDCSYLPDNVETVTIPNSNAGDLYVIVIDNYSGQAGNITVSQTGGSGSTNCDFLSSVTLNNTDADAITARVSAVSNNATTANAHFLDSIQKQIALMSHRADKIENKLKKLVGTCN